MNTEQAAKIASRYTRFAEDEAHNRSPLYETLALGVASDPAVIGFLATLPPERQQPNLLLAAVRHLIGTPADWPTFREAILTHADAVRAVMLTHTTQTNEPARCATLLPVLASLPQPLALIEVGASAGLCLLPDLYGYDYGHRSIHPDNPTADYPIFPCLANATTPLPRAMPNIVWRAGLDLNPLDAADPSQAAWLENLVWPEQAERLRRLRAAMKIATAAKPRVVKGNLLGNELETLCREAPKDATLVIFHTAVLAYIASRTDRNAFAARAMSLCQFWIANETQRIFPDIIPSDVDTDSRMPSWPGARYACPGHLRFIGRDARSRRPAMTSAEGSNSTAASITSRTGAPPRQGDFLLSVNGSPVAWTDPHGGAIEWIGSLPTDA